MILYIPAGQIYLQVMRKFVTGPRISEKKKLERSENAFIYYKL